jgi:oxalate decarboxylase/phosphoglucose isomerase-like protein (cupin superfamily)
MYPPEPNSVTLMLEAVRSSKTSEQTQYITWCKNPKYGHRVNNNRHEDMQILFMLSRFASHLYLFNDHHDGALMQAFFIIVL